MPTTPTSTKKTSTLDVHRRHLRAWKHNQARLQRIHGSGRTARPLSILAIDPGSRRIGYAVFEGTELVFGRVKDFGYQRHLSTVVRGTRRLVEDQIRYFKPQLLVLERTFAGYRNKDISKLVAVSEEIRTVAREQALPIVEYAPRTARLIVLGNGNATKTQVAEALCLRYPELRIHLEQTHLWKETYWSNCYDAVCVGAAYLVEKRFAPPIHVPATPAPAELEAAHTRRPGS